MTPAELRTLRQSLFLSEADAAALAGATIGQLRAWEAPGGAVMPGALERELRRLDDLVETMARQTAATLAAQTGARAGKAVLLRYAEDADLAAVDPAAAAALRSDLGLAAALHAAALARTCRAVAEASGGVPPLRLVWFDAADYAAWLPSSGLEDGPDARIAWAADRLERSEHGAAG